jgi:hypothetical protein
MGGEGSEAAGCEPELRGLTDPTADRFLARWMRDRDPGWVGFIRPSLARVY